MVVRLFAANFSEAASHRRFNRLAGGLRRPQAMVVLLLDLLKNTVALNDFGYYRTPNGAGRRGGTLRKLPLMEVVGGVRQARGIDGGTLEGNLVDGIR